MRKSAAALTALFIAGTGFHPAAVQAAPPVLKGYWQLAICSNPDKQCFTGAGLCAQFTNVLGHVGDLPNSGTWKLAGAATLVGKWFQHGDLVQFHGSYNAGLNFISFTGLLNGAGSMSGISFIDGAVASTNMNTGTWHGRKSAACAVTGARMQPGRLISDPD